jgi:hypothetical protein
VQVELAALLHDIGRICVPFHSSPFYLEGWLGFVIACCRSMPIWVCENVRFVKCNASTFFLVMLTHVQEMYQGCSLVAAVEAAEL